MLRRVAPRASAGAAGSRTNAGHPRPGAPPTRRATLALLLSAAPSVAAAQIATGAGAGSHVQVFDVLTGATTASFFAYSPSAGEVRVARGDVNGDGVADIGTGAAPGAAGGHV